MSANVQKAKTITNVVSDMDSADTTAAVVFKPAVKLFKRPTASQVEKTAAGTSTSQSWNLEHCS